MKSLIYRDWVLVRKTKAVYLGLFYLFFLIPDQNNSFMMNFSTNFLFIFIAYLFFSYLTAYDYKYNGLAFTCALPVSKKDVVTARYIFMATTFIAYLIFLMAVKTLINSIAGNGFSIDFQQTGFFIIIFSVFFSIIIPLYYRLGYQKMRWVMFIGMFSAVVLSGVFQEITLNLDRFVFLLASVIASCIIYRVSAYISCRILLTKDL